MMKVKYRSHPSRRHNYEEMPLLHIRLKNGKNIVDLDSLVDSGAGECVFHTDIADALDIDLTTAPTKEYEAVGGEILIGKTHSVQLQVAGFNDEWITLTVGFIDQDEIPILGRRGFFDAYEITFRNYNNQFEIQRRQFKKRLRIKQLRN